VPVWKVITTIVFLLLVTNALILKYKPKKLTIMKNMTVYKVEGMSCNHCKSNVETNIAKLDGVTSVSADLSTGNVVVEGTSTEEQVKTVVESLGFVFKGRLS
jgi:copper chaperone CopZ